METEFSPPRRTGILIQGGLILVLLSLGAYFFVTAVQEPSGLDFLMNMLIALIALSPLPVLIYRLYALINGVYILRRDGLMIRWGLRREDIPLREIEWVRPATELGFRLPMPWLSVPGAKLGRRKVAELGQVEFMASDLQHMILVATPNKVYAISPKQVNQFMKLFQQFNELGSLSPIEAQSIYPKVLIGRVWEDRPARLMILISFAIGVLLLAVVFIAIPVRDTIPWTEPGEVAPAERLLLLPILDSFIWLFNLLLGIFLHRRGGDLKIAAYLLWGSAGLTGFLLLIGSFQLLF